MLGAMFAGLALMSAPMQDVEARASQDPEETRVEDVIVEGRSIRQQAEAYVSELTAAPGRKPLARWQRQVCVGVAGLDATYAQYLVDRISAIAASVGVEPGDPGCRPEILIAFSREPDAIAKGWVAQDLDIFRPQREGGTDLGAEALERFKSSDAPVRWWHVSRSVASDTGFSVTRTNASPEIPYNFVPMTSRIHSPTRERLVRAFIVVDADQIGQTTFGSLSDYLALVALIQVDPKAETESFDTVLNLFVGQGSARLSSWDADYLQSLYRARTNPIRASTQGRHIADSLADRRSKDYATTP